MAGLSIVLFGGFRIRVKAGPDIDIPRQKAQALLAYLAMYPEHSFRRDTLASLLWGDRSDEQARRNLRQVLFALRSALPASPPTVVLGADTLGLAPGAADVDVVEFQRLAADGRPEALAMAATLYQGDLLNGFVLKEPAFEEWLRAERDRLRELALDVLGKLLAHEVASGMLEPAIRTALRVLSLDPLREDTHRTLMRLYMAQGRRAAAVRQYELCVEVLRRDLGTEPEAATRELYQSVLPGRRPATGGGQAPLPRQARRRKGRERGRRRWRTPSGSPLIGRATEIDRLGQLLHDARRGRGITVFIVGEAGVGKTRLLEELEALARRRRATVLSGRAYETTRVLPFAPWIEALRPVIADLGTRVRGLDATWRSELGRLFPELAASEPPSASGDALRLFEAITRFIDGLAEHQPLILVLEDLHWADDMSLRLLAFLGRRLGRTPVLVALTAREEDLTDTPLLNNSLSELRQHSGLVDLQLGPLSRSETLTLVRGMSDSPHAQLEERIWAVSGGNPFVVLEMLRAVSDEATRGDTQRLTQLFPGRVRELVTLRLRRLSERSRKLVAIASVMGRESDFGLLQYTAKLDDHDAAEAVEELLRRRVFRGVDDRLDFTHDWIREAALRELPPVQRRLLHRQIASAIESMYGPDIERHYGALALHYREGEVWDKALSYLQKAAAQARTRYAYDQASTFLEQALDVLQRLPGTDDVIEQEIDVRCDLRMSINPLADDRAMLEHLETAKRLAERIGDRRRLVRALTYLGREHMDLGAYAVAIAIEQEALRVARAVGDGALEVAPTFYMALGYWRRGDLRSARDITRRSIESMPQAEGPDHYGLIGSAPVFYRTLLARCLGGLGAFDEAMKWGKDALRLAEVVGHPYSLYSACLELGALYVARGTIDDAVHLLERGVALARSRDIRLYVHRAVATLALAYALVGRAADARSLLDTIPRESFGARPKRSLDSLSLVLIGHARLVGGLTNDAAWFLERALDIAREFDQREIQGVALHLFGDVLSSGQAADAVKSEHAYRSALALATDLALRPLVAHCHYRLAAACRRHGDEKEADEHLRAAISMYREMDMGIWLRRGQDAARAT